MHRSGGDRWTPGQRQAYANDLGHGGTLIAVSASANRSKGDKDPAQWLPLNAAYRCEYVRTWLAVKAEWEPLMDTAEAQAVRSVQRNCP